MTRRVMMACMIVGLGLASSGCPTDEPLPNETPDQGGSSDMGLPPADQGMDMTSTPRFMVSSVTPSEGPLTGGTAITLGGRGFAPGAKVFVGGVEATEVEVRSATQIGARTPMASQAGTVGIEIALPDGSRASLPNAFTYKGDVPPEGTPVYCRLQAQSPATVTLGVGAPESLYVVIYAEGKTLGQGAGAGVTAELGVGMGTGYEGFSFAAMTYNTDKDGLTPGDLSNDEYGAPPTLTAPGTYRYVARVKVEGAQEEWLYCDLDGSDNGVDEDQLGVIEAIEPLAPEISYCQLVSADPVMVTAGQQSPLLRARVFAQGVTQGGGKGASIEGELGYGAADTMKESYTYAALAYLGDVDGLSMGDLANDEYGTQLLLDEAGTFRYVARFRFTEPVSDWFYCDLDGHDAASGFDPEQAGHLEVTAPVAPSIGYCQTETTTVKARPNQATSAITARVYALGITDAAGQGTGVTAELVWGPAGDAPSSWSNQVAGAYLEDADGLTMGDRANDRYSATITSATEGDFGFAYRFSLDGGATWSWCDTDGSDGTATGFESAKLGALSVQSANLPDACNLQYPTLRYDLVTGMPLEVFGRVSELGVTDVEDDAASISGELWVGPIDADPVTEAARFDKLPLAYYALSMGLGADEDEYSATWTPTAPGAYKYFVRFSVDGTASSSCDFDGGSFQPNKVGVAIVHAAAPDTIDYCNVFQGQVTQSLADPNLPIFTAEVYEAGVTQNNNGANSALLEAEVGYGAVAANPALPGVFSWQPAPFSKVNPGNPNNYEYQGNPYTAATAPAAGSTYDVVIRVRLAGQSDLAWTYCDNFSNTMDFLSEYVSKMTVVP